MYLTSYLPFKSTINALFSSQLIELKASTACGHLLRFLKKYLVMSHYCGMWFVTTGLSPTFAKYSNVLFQNRPQSLDTPLLKSYFLAKYQRIHFGKLQFVSDDQAHHSFHDNLSKESTQSKLKTEITARKKNFGVSYLYIQSCNPLQHNRNRYYLLSPNFYHLTLLMLH